MVVHVSNARFPSKCLRSVPLPAVKMAEGLGLLPAQDFVDKLNSH